MKLENLTSFKAGKDEKEWKEAVASAKPVLNELSKYLKKEISAVDKEMCLESVLAKTNPGQAILTLQCKKEALQSLLDLLDN